MGAFFKWPGIRRVTVVTATGLLSGVVGLVGAEDRYFHHPRNPTKVLITKVGPMEGGAESPAWFLGSLPDGSDVRFTCEYGGRVGESKIIFASRGMFTHRVFVESGCFLEITSEHGLSNDAGRLPEPRYAAEQRVSGLLPQAESR